MSELISLNVAKPREIDWDGGKVATGIFKQPVNGRVALRATNLDGDGQADLSAHGGIHKAVYVYSFDHYAYWRDELGRGDLRHGQFGENFTVAGWTDDAVHIGDIFRVGSALVEVSQPRTPCFKLGLRLGDPKFPKRFLASGRSGFYLRVLEEGEVGAGDALERVRVGPEQMSVQAVSRLLHFERGDRARVERALRIPALAPAWRRPFEEALGKGGSRGGG
jgi:MOSC domain-containing protein YiiM